MRFLKWWTEDIYRPAIAVFGVVFAVILTQGEPYWDADFSIFFAAIEGRGVFRLLLDWISPVYHGAENWGFQDRVAQFLVYRISYNIAGFDTWPHWIFKDLSYGALGVVMYLWALRAGGVNKRIAAAAAAVFFLLSPGPVASHAWLGDFAPTAELCFSLLTYIAWQEIEATPIEWRGFFPPSPEGRRWLVKWIALSFAVYLSYKTKADLKLLPVILAIYCIAIRRRIFAFPIALMLFLTVPWSRSTFTKLPPFVPGSSANTSGYQWHSVDLSQLREFVWTAEPYNFSESLRISGSLAGILGPFLIAAVVVFAAWKLPTARDYSLFDTPAARSRLLVLIWFVVIFASMSVLPKISLVFRIRWLIMPLAPLCVLLGWLFSMFEQSWRQIPRPAAYLGVALFLAQTGINTNRSLVDTRDLTDVMNVIDQMYSYVDQNFPNDQLVFLGFRNYDYHSDASPAIRYRDIIEDPRDLMRHTPGKTLVVVWGVQPPAGLPIVKQFSPCGVGTLIDRIMPCQIGKEITLARYKAPEAPTPESLLNLSMALFQSKGYRESIAAAQAAIKLKPDFAEAYNNIAAAYEEQAMWDEAIAAAKEAIRLKPDFQLAKNNLQWSLDQKAKAKAANR